MTNVFEQHRNHQQYLAELKAHKRERAIKMAEYRYSQTPPLSFAKIGKKFGISRQRAQQIIETVSRRSEPHDEDHY